ncbi:hypothetical protein D3C78_1160370 [compost metagenome]
MRGDDTQRHADGHTDHGGKGDLCQGFHGLLPVPQVEDQQKGEGDEHRQCPFTLDQVREGGEQGDEDERVEPGQGAGDAMDHEFQALGDGVEVIGAILGQPFDE